MANLLSRKVKSAEIPDTFFRLEDVEPSLGVPNDSNSIVVSVTNGDRTFYKIDSGFSFDNDSGARRISIDLSQFGITNLSNVDDSDGLGNVIDGGKLLVYSASRNAFVPSVGGVSLDSNDAVTLNGEGPLFYLDARNHNYNQTVFDSNFGVLSGRDSVRFTSNELFISGKTELTRLQVSDSAKIQGLLTVFGNIETDETIKTNRLSVDSSALVNGNLTAITLSGNGAGLTNLTADSAVFADLAADLESAAFDALFADKTTGELTEGSNLYYTEARADSNITRYVTVNNLRFADTRKATFGDDSDLKIYHDGSSNVYQGSSHAFRNAHGNDVITVDSDHAVLKYDGNAKLTVVDSGIEVTGNISGTNLTLTGDLTITGTTTTVNTTTLQVSDPLIHLAVGNESADVVDIGFFGHYSNDAGVTRQHTGFFRDANNGEYFLFGTYVSAGLDSEIPDTTIDRTDPTFGLAELNLKSIKADSATISGPIKFSNVYATEGALPSAATYHGMFAHVHATGKGYFAHGGQWHKLLDETSSTTDDLTEGSTNQYFTTARARASLGVENTSGTGNGFGSLAYDSTSGAYTLTQVDSDDILTVYSAGNNITISPTGVITASGAPQADNAALLDSLDAIQFLRSDVDDFYKANNTLTFLTGSKLAFGDSTAPTYFTHTGSGLRFVGNPIQNLNVTLFDSLVSGQFLRSDATSNVTSGLVFNDNVQLNFGTDSDAQMYHSGSAFVTRNNTGDYHVQSQGFLIENSTGTEIMIDAEANSFVKLYYDNAVKFSTLSDGARISGTLEITNGISHVNGSNTTEFRPSGVPITTNAITVVDTYDASRLPTTIKYDVHMHDVSTTPDETQVSTVLVAFNGESDVGFTEFGVVHTGDSDMGFLTADVNPSGEVRLLFERRNGRGTIEVKPARTIIK
jgi:cytoskeletal protein CcmA (bactofilin family)